MGTLGKDLLRLEVGRFEITVLFSGDGYEIDGTFYRLGELTTAFLNYDAADLISAVEGGAGERLKEILWTMPLYGGEARRDRSFLWEDCVALAKDIQLIQDRYAWLLREMFHRDLHLHTDNRYAVQLEENGMGAFLSGASLGLASERDPALSAVQFEVRRSARDGTPQLFEKLVFTRLIDFIYTELFRALMQGSCPRPCRNCGTWFLKEKHDRYGYCANPAPGETDKTCRDVGAGASFQAKVKNNEVWRLHQRAYKKYYARVLKKTMTKAEFYRWAQEAEQLRDRVLREYEQAKASGLAYSFDGYEQELNGQ